MGCFRSYSVVPRRVAVACTFLALAACISVDSPSRTRESARTHGSFEIISPEAIPNVYTRLFSALPSPDQSQARESDVLARASISGVLELESGKSVRLAGLACTKGLKQWLESGPLPHPIVMFPMRARQVEGEPVPVYIWLNLQYADGTESFIAVHEMAAMNRWCVPIQEPGHDYYDLYLRIVDCGSLVTGLYEVVRFGSGCTLACLLVRSSKTFSVEYSSVPEVQTRSKAFTTTRRSPARTAASSTAA